MMGLSDRSMGRLAVLFVVVLLSACGTRTVNRAPVADGSPGTSVEAGAAVAPAAQQPPGFENAGKAGYYTVKPGDTMIRIGMETGQSWRDIARWNGLVNPNVIEVGQVLRVLPPVASNVPPATVLAGAKPAAAGAPVPVAPASAAGGASVTPVAPPAVTTAAVAPSTVTTTAVAPVQGGAAAGASAEDAVALIWPASGAVVGIFDEVKNKGLDIGGAAGDPVVAAADGRVVYVGSSLRGYGNLIILKHNNTYLTAYAHNQALLVKEDQTVRRGQKIAEMGNSDADRVKLHFEVRRQGKPVDPAKYLPPR